MSKSRTIGWVLVIAAVGAAGYFGWQKYTDNQQAIAIWRERLERGRELECRPGRRRRPVFHHDAVRHVDDAEPRRRPSLLSLTQPRNLAIKGLILFAILGYF